MERLTDRRTAEALRSNAEKLKAKGFCIPVEDLRYIKLADYENIVENLVNRREEERKEQTFVSCDPDDYYE